jgi:energy-coupling factor transport system substrate-specific component
MFMGFSITERIQRETPGALLPFVAFCVALNLTAGQLTALLKIPLYLDAVGTVLLAVLCGPWVASIAGAASNLLAGAFGNPTMIFFIPVMVAIAVFSSFVARRGWFRTWYLVVGGGIVQGIIAALISAPISAYLFSGVTLGGTDLLVIFFRSMGHSLLDSVFYQGLSSDPIDKTITYLIAYFLVMNIPRRLLQKFPGHIHLVKSAPQQTHEG